MMLRNTPISAQALQKTKGARLLLAFLLCAAMSVVLFAAPMLALADETTSTNTSTSTDSAQKTYVFDERGLFSSAELSALESQAEELANKYNMGVYLLTCSKMNGLSDPSSSERTNFATNYYKEHGLGLNKTDKNYGDGIMLVIAADSRDYVTIAYGQGSYSFSDKGIESMEDDVTDALSDNDWYGGASAYYKDIGRQLAYYDQHGKPENPLSMFDWLIRLFLVLGVPFIITFFIINGWRNEMLTAVEKSEASNYLDRESVNVTNATDKFIRTSVVATPIPKNEGNSGGWGGGGGGGFSSSGGGKF